MNLKPQLEDQGQITQQFLKKLIKSNFKLYYSNPELNETFYLHYKGFKRITNLEPYTELKVLYLEGNQIKKIEGLSKMVNLRCLYLQQNLIQRIEGIECLKNLVRLNLSDNLIQKIEQLNLLENLETLLLKRNRIGSHIDDLEGLLSAPSIETLDLSSNLIEKEDALQVFFQMPKIVILNLDNNEVKKKILHYRKHLIGEIPALVCLDDNPVFEDEKKYALAWKKGGIQQQKKERELLKREREQKMIDQRKQQKERRQRLIQRSREHFKTQTSEPSKESGIESYDSQSSNQQQQLLDQLD